MVEETVQGGSDQQNLPPGKDISIPAVSPLHALVETQTTLTARLSATRKLPELCPSEDVWEEVDVERNGRIGKLPRQLPERGQDTYFADDHRANQKREDDERD